MLLTLLAGASFTMAEPLIIAHRGASAAAPENTLVAFRLAWEEGADGIEGDFYLTADGEVVCMHDKTTKRTAKVDLPVTKTAWSELAELDVGSWKDPRYAGERPPLLEEVLDILPPGKFFFIEIKDGVRIVAPIQRILAEKQADPARVILIAFDAEVVRECGKVMPDYQAHWLSSLKDIDRPGMADTYFAELKRTGASGLQFQAAAPVSAEWLGSVKEAGYALTSWTVNDPEIGRRLLGSGVDFITTDRPGGLRAELGLPAGSGDITEK